MAKITIELPEWVIQKIQGETANMQETGSNCSASEFIFKTVADAIGTGGHNPEDILKDMLSDIEETLREGLVTLGGGRL